MPAFPQGWNPPPAAGQPVSAGPPATPAADLWAALTQIPRPHKDIPFPRRGAENIKLRIVVLTEQELMACRVAAERYAKTALQGLSQNSGESNLGYLDIYNSERVHQVICACSRDPNSPNISSRAFPNPDLARGYFTQDEIAVIFNAYCEFQVESGPIISSMSPEEMEAWVEKLVEGASRTPLAQLSSEAKSDLIMHLIAGRMSSQTANSSAGSPLAGS